LDAYQTLQGPPFERFLEQWRAQVNTELRENRRGFLPHRTSLSLPHGFPDLSILEKYANPLTTNGSSSVALRDQGNFDPAQIATLCEEFFEWGYRSKIIERFRNFLWPCAVIHVLRRAALKVDEMERSRPATQQVDEGGVSPSAIKKYLTNTTKRADVNSISNAFANREPSPSLTAGNEDLNCLITKIIGSRQHASTDGILEYRIEIQPTQLVEISNSGIIGTRREAPGTPKIRDTDPNSPLRLWVAASILRRVYPRIVDEFVNRSQSRRNGKGGQQSLELSSDATNETSLMVVNYSPLRYGNDDDLRALSNTWDPRKGGSRETLLLDPWFRTAVPSEPLMGRQSTGFLFAFRNPEPTEIVGEGAGIPNEGNEESDQDRPLTRFQRFCDQILTAPSTKARKSTKRKVVERTGLNVQGPSKKPRTSAVLDALDLL
jgi:Holliday junction resolvase YEN1